MRAHPIQAARTEGNFRSPYQAYGGFFCARIGNGQSAWRESPAGVADLQQAGRAKGKPESPVAMQQFRVYSTHMESCMTLLLCLLPTSTGG